MNQYWQPWRLLLAAFSLFFLFLPLGAAAETWGGIVSQGSDHEIDEATQPSTLEMPPGSLQAQIDGAEAGSVVVIARGIYRETVTIDKPLTLAGEPGAEIRGSDIWSDGWERRGDHWYHAGAPDFGLAGEWCRHGSNGRCNWPDQVFVNGSPLSQVEGLPASGQFAVSSSREIILAEDPFPSLVEVTMRRAWVVTKSDGVTIEGFTMRHAADRLHEGALSNGGHANWTIQNNVLLHAHIAPVSIREASGLKISGNEIAFGGRMGIHSWQARDVEIAGNTIHSNNTEEFEDGWEAGGMKLSGLSNSNVKDNVIYDNDGAGIWCDVDCTNVVIENNRVHHNRRYGILYEISRDGKILNNQVWENGWGFPAWGFGGGIVCQNCRNTEMAGNIVAWNADGISVISQMRNGHTDVANNFIHDNVIVLMTDWTQNTYMLAWLEDWSGRLTDQDSNNRGANNSYYHAAPEGAFLPFTWGRHQRFGINKLAEFSATPGEDNGRLLAREEALELLANNEMPLDPQPRP